MFTFVGAAMLVLGKSRKISTRENGEPGEGWDGGICPDRRFGERFQVINFA